MPVLETSSSNLQINMYEGSVGPISGKWGGTPGVGSRKVCRVYSARRPETIRRGANHPQYSYGGETLEAKAERSRRLAELRDLECLMLALGMLDGSRWRGRRPKRQV